MLNPKGLAWVGLFAADLSTLADFYEQTVGLCIVKRDQACCIFDAGSGAQFEIWGGGLAKLQRKTSHEQSMLAGFLVERLEVAIELLRKNGLHPDTEIDGHLGARWIHYTDPEGNRFELKDNNS